MNSRTRLSVVAAGAGLLTLLCGSVWAAQEPKPAEPKKITPEQTEFFETRVRPVLFKNCFSCHGDKLQQSGVRLDSLEGMIKRSSAGNPTLVPGDIEKSHLVQVIRYNGRYKMPPGGKLKDNEIADLTAWVKMGAPWPGAKVSDAARKAAESGEYVISDDQRRFWSFTPVKKPPVPVVKNKTWVANPIDAYVLASLEKKGIKPNPRADKKTLIRRAYYDLIGLPPTADEVRDFYKDNAPNAYEKVIDRLLNMPQYGERWGRYWLDVARYADTKGYVFTEDAKFHYGYTYRDWVIRSFNEDLPYDQFLMQQLAADLMNLGEDRRPLAALGLLTIGRRFLNDPVLINDDRIDTVSRGMLGLSVACARCHDHKFDPISAKDYYALYGVFASSVESNPMPPISPKAISEPYDNWIKQVKETEDKRNRTIMAQVGALHVKLEKSPADLPDNIKKTLQAFRVGTMPTDPQLAALVPQFEPTARIAVAELKTKLDSLRKSPPQQPELAMAVNEAPQPFQPYVFLRGNAGNRGPNVPRRFLAILSKDTPKPFEKGSGRLELAQAIASKENPLTARVMVNRIWMGHFGKPIVLTPSDFGTRGEAPTNQPLMDYLAAQFMDDDWSIKKLHKRIMLSNAYQMTSTHNPASFAKDPENHLVWKMNRRRLDLEAMRDSLLYVAGKLDDKVGGKAVEITTAPFSNRRTVYGFIDRQNLQNLFRTFDFASPDTSSAQRFQTTIPQQALFMMNSPFIVDQAKQVLERPEFEKLKDDHEIIKGLYQTIYGRSATEEEIKTGLAFTGKPIPEMLASPWQYGFGGFDDKAQRTTNFTKMPFWNGSQYQGGKNFPDPNLGYVLLTTAGGHTGNDVQHAVIRRWTAPADATLQIDGQLGHGSGEGDGVRARIVSSRNGLLAEWSALNKTVETSLKTVVVKKGETLDFAVDCKGTNAFDSFSWAPTLTGRITPQGVVPAGTSSSAVWSAQADFAGPEQANKNRLNRWQQLVQVLLMTNEFTFVD